MNTGYLIRITSHYYTGAVTTTPRVDYCGIHGRNSGAPLVPFATKQAAREGLELSNSSVYYTRNGECSRPTLAVVQACNAPAWVAEMLERAQ